MKKITPIFSLLHSSSIHLPVLLFLLSLLLNSCVSLWSSQDMAAPTVSLAAIELQGIKGLETIFLLKLRIMNLNDEPLEIHGLNCGVQINGNFFATGVSDEPVTLPASGTAVLQVTVYTSMIDIAGSIIALLQEDVQHSGPPAKPVEYELTGELRLGEQGERTVPFQLQGDFPPEQ